MGTEEPVKRIPKRVFSVSTPANLYDKIKAVATQRKIAMSTLGVEILSEHLEEHAPDLEREALLEQIRLGEEAKALLATKDAAKAARIVAK